jgi:hypothetical protein
MTNLLKARTMTKLLKRVGMTKLLEARGIPKLVKPLWNVKLKSSEIQAVTN